MKKKSGTEYLWVLFSVVSVVAPFLLSVILACLINEHLPPVRELLNSIILIVFSIACSLLSICVQVCQQKKDKRVIAYLVVSGVFIFIAWTTYTISLIKALDFIAQIITIVSCLVIIILSYCGIKMGKKSDENEHEAIRSMHSNCEYIRGAFIGKKKNESLRPLSMEDYDLLCDPNKLMRVKECINNIISSIVD